MAFSVEAGAAGAAQGSAAGPWGAVAGFAVGGILGGKGKKRSRKARRLQRQYMAQAIEAIKRQNEISTAQWSFYQENVKPMEEQIGADLAAGRVGGAPEAMQHQYRSKASGDVMQSFGRQREITKRQQASFGIDPTSGAAMAQEQKAATAAGLGEAGSMTRAGEQASEDYRGERDRFIGRWSGQPGEAFQQQGGIAEAYGSAADYYGGVGEQERAKVSEQMQAFLPAAVKGAGYLKDRYGGGAEKNPTYDGPSFAEGGPAVNEAIAGGYGMTGAEGGAITGPGGPVDDKVPTQLPEKSYVIPADVVNAMGVDFFDKLESSYAEGGAEGMQNRVNAMTSDGEYVISPNVVQRKGKKFFDDLVAKHHKPAAQQSKQYQSKTANAADGASHQFIKAANGYKGQLNTTAPAGPTARHYAHGGSVSSTGSEDGELIKPDKMHRRGRLRHGRRAEGGYTGGKDLYQGTYDDGGQVPIQAGVGEGNLGGGGARAYHDGGDAEDQVGRRGGKSLKEGGYSAGRTSVSQTKKPLGMHGKDGGETPKKKTRRGGKKHNPKYQDGGMKSEVKGYKGGGHALLGYKEGGTLTSEKAKKMLKDGMVDGKKLTAKQKGYFGAVAGGTAYKAEGGVAYWEPGMPGRPKAGDKGPVPKKIRGDYTGSFLKKPGSKTVKRRVYASEPGSKKYGEE